MLLLVVIMESAENMENACCTCDNAIFFMPKFPFINSYSMKQPDLYVFETIKMMSQAKSNFV